MFVRRRIKNFMLIKNGLQLRDKINLLLLACFYILPNKLTNLNAETPQTLIKYISNTQLKLDEKIYKLNHPRQLFMILDQYERKIQDWFNLKGNTFLDIGANIGKYSIKLSDSYREVHAF